jgi:hypothetical protein
MAGTIGLTAAGQELDKFLTAMADRKTAARITAFVVKLTGRLHTVRGFDDEFTLGLYRAYYKEQAEKRFGSLEEKPKSLLLNYIHTLTKPIFVPTTRTQEALLRRSVAPSTWTSVASFFGLSV